MYVTSPGEILIRPDLMMQPDILVFRAASPHLKWEAIREHWLAVEIWSPSSVIYDREVKRDAYLQIGVREVWQVDCERKVVLVSAPGGPLDQVREGVLLWRPGATHETISIDLGGVFRGLD